MTRCSPGRHRASPVSKMSRVCPVSHPGLPGAHSSRVQTWLAHPGACHAEVTLLLPCRRWPTCYPPCPERSSLQRQNLRHSRRRGRPTKQAHCKLWSWLRRESWRCRSCGWPRSCCPRPQRARCSSASVAPTPTDRCASEGSPLARCCLTLAPALTSGRCSAYVVPCSVTVVLLAAAGCTRLRPDLIHALLDLAC